MIAEHDNINPDHALDQAVTFSLGIVGTLLGRTTIGEVLSEPEIATFMDELVKREVLPVIDGDQILLDARATELLAKLAASDTPCDTVTGQSSEQIGPLLLDTIRARRQKGEPSLRLSMLVAVWMQFASGFSEDGEEIDLQDSKAERLLFLGHQARSNPDAIATAYLGETDIFGDDLPNAAPFRQQVVTDTQHLLNHGVLGAISAVNRRPT